MVVCVFASAEAQVSVVDNKGNKIVIAPYTLTKNATKDSFVLSNGTDKFIVKDSVGGTASYVETDPIVRTINGLVKSNGATISAASPIYDYLMPTGSANALTNFPQFPESQITNLVSDLAAKQATLVSGSNIKTVNGNSLLGSGDISIGGGGTVIPSQPATVITLQTGTVPPAFAYIIQEERELLFDPNLVFAGQADIYLNDRSPENGRMVNMRFGGTIAFGQPVCTNITFYATFLYGAGVISDPNPHRQPDKVTLSVKGGDVYSFRYEAQHDAYYFIKLNN